VLFFGHESSASWKRLLFADSKVNGGLFLAFCARPSLAPVHAQVPDSFNPAIKGAVYATALQADRKILLGGQFTLVNHVARSSLARLMRMAAWTRISLPRFLPVRSQRRSFIASSSSLMGRCSWQGISRH